LKKPVTKKGWQSSSSSKSACLASMRTWVQPLMPQKKKKRLFWARCSTSSCNPSTREAEVGGSQVWSQPGLCSKTLPHRAYSGSNRDKSGGEN
jgi:hypothetical protein